MNFRPYDPDQTLMFPPALRDLIAADDPVYVVSEAMDRFDLSAFYALYSEEGNPAYHPRMMIKVLYFAYSQRIMSSRRIARAVSYDVRFMYLTALQKPDFRTLSDFRKRHRKQIPKLFAEIDNLCQELGYIGFQHLAIDGTKIEANAGWKRAYTRDKLEKERQVLEQEIASLLAEAEAIDQQEDAEFGADRRGDELPAELADARRRQEKIDAALQRIEEQGHKQINLTDPDARVMQHYGGKRDWSYNAQIAVDDQRGIIVAAAVTNEITDQHQLEPLYEQAVENLGQKPDQISADAGYATGAVYQYLEKNGIDAYIPDQNLAADKQKSNSPYARDQFRYNEAKDCFICPVGQELTFHRCHPQRGVITREYRGKRCPDCSNLSQCVKRGKHRYLIISQTDAFQKAMRAKLDSVEGRRKYLRRQATVEPVFGHIKRNMGFTHFLLRGLENVQSEFLLWAGAVNLLKIKLSDLRSHAPPKRSWAVN